MAQKDKLTSDLQRLLKSQNFKNEEEANSFLNSLMGKPLPSLSKEDLSPQEQAEDMVFEAWGKPFEDGLEMAVTALEIDPDCIAAYEFLAANQGVIGLSLPFYAYGVEIGRRLFGGSFLLENKGHFWGIVETRPFMRCLHQYAACLYALDKNDLAFAIYREILDLNPGDNQGIRYEYQLYLIESGKYDEFEKVDLEFQDEISAFACFNRTLFSFIKEGDTEKSRGLLKKAIAKNKFVVAKLLSPNPPERGVNAYALGSKEEALHYVSFAWETWDGFEKALAWLRKNKK